MKVTPGFLAKKGGRWRSVRLLELAVLLYHAHIASQDTDVGFEDANESLDNISRRLNKWIYMDPAIIESALWACNLLNEKNKFSHPRGLTFDQFVDKILKGRGKYDTFYNLIEWKDDYGDRTPDPNEEYLKHTDGN